MLVASQPSRQSHARSHEWMMVLQNQPENLPMQRPWTLCPKLTHRTRGLPRGQTPRADPATINPLERLTSLLLGFHWGVLQVIKSPGPMEQFVKFLFGFRVGFIQVIRPPRPHGTIHHISVRVSCRVYTSSKIPQPHATIGHISIRVSFRVL